MQGQSSKVSLVCALCGASFLRWPAEIRKARGHVTYCSVECTRRAKPPRRTSGVYAIVHSESGLRYIGSSGNLEKRFRSHRWKLDHETHENPVLQARWAQDGAGAFAFEILECVTGTDALISAEQVWLDRYEGSLFNIYPNAGGSRGYRWTPEKRAARKGMGAGKVLSPETRAKIAARAMGNTRAVGNTARRSLTSEQVGEIRARRANGEQIKALASEFNVATWTIARAGSGKTYTSVEAAAVKQRYRKHLPLPS